MDTATHPKPDPETEALFRAVLRDPYDDTVRLVYADRLDDLPVERIPCPICSLAANVSKPWARDCTHCRGTKLIIDDNNKVRAEYIRKQIRITQIEPNSTETRELRTRCLLLFESYGWRWTGVLDEIGFQANSTWVPEVEYTFHRGFVRSVELLSTRYEEYVERIFRTHPVTHMTLPDRKPWNATADLDRTMVGWPFVNYASTLGYPADTRVQGFAWFSVEDYPREDSGVEREDVPDCLLQTLSRYEIRSVSTADFDFWRGYGVEADAVADLKRACVCYGRHAVGLPPIEPEVC